MHLAVRETAIEIADGNVIDNRYIAIALNGLL